MENEALDPDFTPDTSLPGSVLPFENRITLEELQQHITSLKTELAKVIVGQHHFIELLIVALLSDGHVLIEGVPGIAKTITTKLFAKTLQTQFSRIQFTFFPTLYS